MSSPHLKPNNLSERSPHVEQDLLQTSPYTEQTRARENRASSGTESIQNERTPLVQGSRDNSYSTDQNIANNLDSTRDSTKTPPPRSKLNLELNPSANIPHSGGAGPADTIHQINDDGPPAFPEVQAPNRRVNQPGQPGENQPGQCRVTYGCVLRRLRMSCCIVSVFIVLSGLVLTVVWPTAISYPSHLLNNTTTPIGILFIEPSNRLTKGGVTVALNVSNMSDSSTLRTQYYYGPMPSEELYNRNDTFLDLYFSKVAVENSACHLFEPFVFETGHGSGFFNLVVEKSESTNTEVMVVLSVFRSYEEAVSTNCRNDDGCNLEAHGADEITYSYNSSSDNCDQPRPSSYYGIRRYFRIAVKSTNGFDELAQVTLNSFLTVTSFGKLNVSAVGSFRDCSAPDETTKMVTCNIPYNFFFSELGGDNHLIIVTNSSDTGADHVFSEFNTVVTVSSQEGLRGDVIGVFVGIVLLTILIVFISYTYKQLGTYPCACVKWTVTNHGTKYVYRVLVGETPQDPGP